MRLLSVFIQAGPRGRFFTKLLLLALLVPVKGLAQPPRVKVYNYIEKYSEMAVKQMVEFKIPASVILAQAICESSSGTSDLARRANNHFGIKCHVGWVGESTIQDDDSLNECFRSYRSIEESYKDHSRFLSSRPRYAELFKLSLTDYKSWCLGLKAAGYATSPDYANKLIRIIEEAGLYELDGYEPLTTEVRRLEKEPELKVSRYTGKGFSVRDFSRAGFLWTNASDIPSKHLDLVVARGKAAGDELAGN
jgi:hypothetical protein